MNFWGGCSGALVALSPHPRLWGPLCVDFACCPCVCVWALSSSSSSQLPPTVHRHAGYPQVQMDVGLVACPKCSPLLPNVSWNWLQAPLEPPPSMNSMDNGCEFCHNRKDGRMLSTDIELHSNPPIWTFTVAVPTNFSESKTLSLTTSHTASLMDQCCPSCYSAGIWSGKKALVSMYPLTDACIPTYTHASTKLFQLVLIHTCIAS